MHYLSKSKSTKPKKMSSRARNSNQENEKNKDNDDVSMYFNNDPTLYETLPSTPAREIRQNEESETSTSAAISPTSAATTIAYISQSSSLGSTITLTQEEIEEIERILFPRSEFVSQISGSGVGPSATFNHSSGASNSEHPGSESRKKEAESETVTYDYIFRKQLTYSDGSKGIRIPKAEAVKHVQVQVQGSSQPVQLHVYDFNRKQTMTWSLKYDPKEYPVIRGVSSKYIDENNLQKGDSVLFYTRKSNQKIKNTTLPLYAVQTEKSTENIGEGVLCIPLNDLKNSGKEQK